MADTYSQMYVHVIFGPSRYSCNIDTRWEDELYKYITGIIQNKDQKLLIINGVEDHIHMLIGIKPTCCLSDLIREVKKASTTFIKQKRLTRNRFFWQRGFGAFTCGYSQLDQLIHYIENQKIHHRKMTFENEYIEFLEKYDVDYKQQYLFCD
jgi:REP element-mobilizing transposase RayT